MLTRQGVESARFTLRMIEEAQVQRSGACLEQSEEFRGGDLGVAAMDEVFHLAPGHPRKIKSKSDPVSGADVWGEIKLARIALGKPHIITRQHLAADADDLPHAGFRRVVFIQ